MPVVVIVRNAVEQSPSRPVRRTLGTASSLRTAVRPNPSSEPDPLRQAASPARRLCFIMRRAGKSSRLRGQGLLKR